MMSEEWTDEDGNVHYGKKIVIPNVSNPTVRVKLENSDQIENLERKLADAESKLTDIALREWNRRTEHAMEQAEKLGLNVDFISNPDELKVIERQIENAKPKNSGNRDIPLSGRQRGDFSGQNNENKPILDREYGSVAEMMSDLDRLAKEGNREAQNTLLEIGKKELAQLKDFEFEYQGKITEGNDPEQRSKWTKKRKLGV